jgi:hypothetical protein
LAMTVPSAILNDHWYYATESGHAGPMTATAIQELLRKGVVTYETLVWNSAFGKSWKPVRDTDFGIPKPPPLPKRSRINRALDVFSSVVRWAIVLLIVAGVAMWLNLPESPEQKAAKAQAMTIGQSTILRLRQSGWQPTWDAVQIKEAKPDHYTFVISYRYSPGTYDAADADTRSVIRAALAEITRAGFVPTNTVVNGITVFTEQKVSGETGTPLYRDFGHAFYSPVLDRIEFKRP